MKKLTLFAGLALGCSVLLSGCESSSTGPALRAVSGIAPAGPDGPALRASDDKATICHIPPGNPDNAHTIVIGAAAVDAHLAHGDLLGPCPPPEDEECDGDAYADAVVEFEFGGGPPRGTEQDALGAPDFQSAPISGILALGAEGVITLEFVDEAIVDGPGADFAIYEATLNASEPEGASYQVAQCADGDFLPIEPVAISGDELFVIEFDLADVGLEYATLVRIIDDGDDTFGGNGYDVDAVVAMSCGDNACLEDPDDDGDDDQDEDEERVTICHRPPGNPENERTITVGAAAVDAHLAHGDSLGECD